MVDFSRAEGSKNHRVSFLKATNAVIANMQELQAEYRTHWDQLETLRKDRAAIIEDTIQLLKANSIKPNKQLGKCDNSEINMELLQAINNLPDVEKENIQINLVKINNRYKKIDELSQILVRLEMEASRFSTKEEDRDEEVEIIIGNPNTDSNIPKNIQFVNDYKIPNKSESIISDEVSKNIEEINFSLSTDEFKDDKPIIEQTDECILFTMNNKNTLKKIAKSVYGNEDYWKYIYNYANNKTIIDRKAAEKGVSIEEIATNPVEGYLDNITLQFPTVLLTQEEIDTE